MHDTTILVVCEDEEYVATLSGTLTTRGITVIRSCGGEDALAKLEEHPEIDVVLLDLEMPCMDGMETLRRIKKSNCLAEVIVLTGHRTVESAIQATKLGAFDYLKKPGEAGDGIFLKIEEAKKKKFRHQTKVLEEEGTELRREIGH